MMKCYPMIEKGRNEKWQRAFSLFLALQIVLNIFNSDVYMQLSGFFIPLGVAICIGSIFINRKRYDYFQLLTFAMLGIFLLNSTVNLLNTERGYLFSYFMLLLLLLELVCMSPDGKWTREMENACLCVGLMISLAIIFFRVGFYMNLQRITIQIGNNPTIDPNYLACYLIAPILLVFNKLLKNTSSILEYLKENAYLIVLLLLMGVGVFLTGSRGAFLALVLGVGCLTFFSKKWRWKTWIILLLCCALVVASGLLFFYDKLNRFFDISKWFDGSNKKRFLLWQNASEGIFESVRSILGYGARESSGIIGPLTGNYDVAHNTFLEVWLQEGLVFLVCLLAVMVGVWQRRGNWLAKALILATVAVSVFISAETNLFFWLNIGLAIRLTREEEKNEG